MRKNIFLSGRVLSACAGAFSALLLAGGCVNVVYPELPRIPDYPETSKKYNTSAVIELIGNDNGALTQRIQKKLTELNYTRLSNGTYYTKTIPEDIKIFQVLDLSHFTHQRPEGFYLQTRLIVMIRPPGVLWKEEIHYAKPRYFQAHAMIPLGNRQALPADYENTLDLAVNHLFRIHPLRAALEPDSVRKNIPGVQKGNALSYWERSRYYQIHEPVKKLEALRWAYHAARLGNREAQKYVVQQALHENFFGDNKRFMSVVLFLANAGFPEAQYKLAQMYEQGEGVSADPVTALRWHKEAAGQGLAIALFSVAQYYEQGNGGVTADLRKAAEYYRKAQRRGHPTAQEEYQRIMDELNSGK